jgi:hypothetical protein
MVNLRNERAHRVDNVTSSSPRFLYYFRCRPVRRQHNGHSIWYFCNIVDENDAEVCEAFHNKLVVHDFVIAVNRGRKGAHHPRESLDGHFYSGAKTTRCGK